MKKMFLRLLLLPLIMAIVGCSNQDAPIANEAIQSDVAFRQPHIRSINDAVSIANKLLGEANPAGRSVKSVSASNVQAITTHASRSGVDTLMYAVDFGDDNGFVLVSAPRNVEPILAITERGSFNDPETKSNAPFQAALENAKSYVSNMSIGGYTPINPEDTSRYQLMKESYYDTIQIDETKIGNPLTNEWGLKWPFNYYCPNLNAGCGPLAVAEVLSEIAYESYFVYDYDGKDVDEEYIDWQHLKLHNGGINYDLVKSLDEAFHCRKCELSLAEHRTLARAVRHIGEHVGAVYGFHLKDIEDTDDYAYGITTSDYDLGCTFIKNEVPSATVKEGNSGPDLFKDMKANPGIACVCGYYYDDTETLLKQHIWVVDGAMERVLHLNKYVPDNSVIGTYKLDSYHIETKRYLHHNWGWYGSANGYFLQDVFVTTRGYQYDYDVNKADLPKYSISYDFKYTLFIRGARDI